MAAERVRTPRRVPIFDLDGTLLDSDEALTAPFVALGIAADAVPFGMTLVEACDQLGVSLDDYLSHYDGRSVRPFAGITSLLSSLEEWAIFSNKLGRAGAIFRNARRGGQPRDDPADRGRYVDELIRGVRGKPKCLGLPYD